MRPSGPQAETLGPTHRCTSKCTKKDSRSHSQRQKAGFLTACACAGRVLLLKLKHKEWPTLFTTASTTVFSPQTERHHRLASLTYPFATPNATLREEYKKTDRRASGASFCCCQFPDVHRTALIAVTATASLAIRAQTYIVSSNRHIDKYFVSKVN